MSWSERGELLTANLRLGWRLHKAHWPWGVFLLGRYLPELVRMLLYVLIGRIVAGPEGMTYAFVGVVVLVVVSAAVAEISDLPVYDTVFGTYPKVRCAIVPPVWQFAARALPLIAIALLLSAGVAVAVGPAAGLWPLVPDLLIRLPLLVPGILSAMALGLTAIAPAIGTWAANATYNVAAAVLTVGTGAVFPVTSSTGLSYVSQVLPLTHTIAGVRASLAGVSPWPHLGNEVLVGMGWMVMAVLVYTWQDRRARKRGVGALA